MSRNELIIALLRVFGVILLVQALLQIPAYAGSFVVTLFELFRSAARVGLGFAFEHFPFATLLTNFLTLALQLFLGYYLMRGGPVFVRHATQESSD